MTSFLISKRKEMCSGCRACQHICPVNAIEMLEDVEGFIYPQIDLKKCINCGQCVEVCPYTNRNEAEKEKVLPEVYAVANKDKYILEKSSSGGVFSVLSNFIKSRSGYVAGCLFDDNFKAIHVISNEDTVISEMRGSKYVQSDTLNTFSDAKKILDDDKWVIYSGTPCQIAGLKRYLRKDYNKLITIDLICHGTPSNMFFQSYLKWQEEKINGKVTKFRFRDKSVNKWSASGSYEYLNHNKKMIKSISPNNNFYYNYYMSGSIYRECCYTCKYASIKREADFTIGDYWGIEKYHQAFYPPEGVSVILINTDKGKKVFKEIEENLKSVRSNLKFALESNGNLSKPSERPLIRDTIYQDLDSYGFEAIAKRDCELSLVKPWIKKLLPYKVKAKIKYVISKIRN